MAFQKIYIHVWTYVLVYAFIYNYFYKTKQVELAGQTAESVESGIGDVMYKKYKIYEIFVH